MLNGASNCCNCLHAFFNGCNHWPTATDNTRAVSRIPEPFSIYFTPPEFMQTIYGANGAFSKDPIYLDLLIENAKKYLVQSNIDVPSTIKLEQATAINAIAHLSDDEHINSKTKIKLYKLVLESSKHAEQFAKIINKVTEVCDYLPHVTEDNASNKSHLIKFHANNYKKSVFLESFEFLSKNKSNIQDKKLFADNIYKAECVFRTQALGIERNIIRTVFRLLTNFITHITGVALILNTINKVKTGNWLLFKHNRSENAVRDARKSIMNDVDKIGVEQVHVDELSNKSSNP